MSFDSGVEAADDDADALTEADRVLRVLAAGMGRGGGAEVLCPSTLLKRPVEEDEEEAKGGLDRKLCAAEDER